jgi:small subunit ribosomal protein S18
MSKKSQRSRRKVCPFCRNLNLVLDYKDPRLLGQYITERGKIMPRRITGVCAKHQRVLAL